MAWKGCLPIFSVLATVLIVLPTIGESKHSNFPWKCHKCHPGYFITHKCNSSSDTICAPCSPGTYTNHLNRLSHCKRCSTCPSGHRQQAACNRVHDTKCVLSPFLKQLHNTAGYQGDEPVRPAGYMSEPTIDDGSGELPIEKESRFSNIFTDNNGVKVKYSEIPDLFKIEKSEEEERYQEELSGDSPIKPNLFDMDSFEPRLMETNISMTAYTEEATLTTVNVSDDVTTALLPDKEAQIDYLIPIQETKVGAQLTTTTVDTGAEGSATSTLAIKENPETTTETPVQPEVAEGEAPKNSSEPEIESSLSTLSTTLVVQQVPDVVTETVVNSFNEMDEPIKPSVAVSNVSEMVNATVAETTTVVPFSVHASTTATPVVVRTTFTDTEVSSTTEQQVIAKKIDSESESKEKADSVLDSNKVTETSSSSAVTESGVAATTFTLASAVDTSTVTEPVTTTTVVLKKIIVPSGETIDVETAARNKTPIAEIIPLERANEHLQTTTARPGGESTSKDADAILSAGASVVPIDLTTPEQTYPWINGSELLQEPAVDNVNSEVNRHMDVTIAAVITGVGLVVLAIIAVRYCVKKRTFKDMRRAHDRMRIQMNETKELKRKDSQTDDSFQTAIYDDIELQPINGGGKHLNGKANGHCKDANGSSPNNEIMSAVNCNYRPADDRNTRSNISPAVNAPIEDLYAVPNKLVVSDPAEPLLNDKSQTTGKGETTSTPGFRLEILDNLKYIDETTDEEGEYVPTRMYLRQAADDVYSSAEDLLLHGANNLDAIAEESTPMLRRLSDDQS